jgi:hypothetical protein
MGILYHNNNRVRVIRITGKEPSQAALQTLHRVYGDKFNGVTVHTIVPKQYRPILEIVNDKVYELVMTGCEITNKFCDFMQRIIGLDK